MLFDVHAQLLQTPENTELISKKGELESSAIIQSKNLSMHPSFQHVAGAYSGLKEGHSAQAPVPSSPISAQYTKHMDEQVKAGSHILH